MIVSKNTVKPKIRTGSGTSCKTSEFTSVLDFDYITLNNLFSAKVDLQLSIFAC